MNDITKFKKYLQEWNIYLSDDQYQQFLLYYDILVEWNKVMNLTTIIDFDEVILKHFVDSLSLVKVQDLSKKLHILDLGTGAGFPGIPLKIVYPNLKIVLLDSLNKRVKFLNEVIEKLKLDNIKAVHGRAEDFAKDINYRESFDICVSRAVSNLATLSEYCIPYVKVGGNFIPYKSGKILEELEMSKKAMKTLGGELCSVETFQLPESDIERSLVVIIKKRHTPAMYPRSAGKPSKEPIL